MSGDVEELAAPIGSKENLVSAFDGRDHSYEVLKDGTVRVRFEAIQMFAGFRIRTLIFSAIIAALVVWNAWVTRELVALKRHRLVSVSLATIISDFVRDQSHNQGSPDDAAMRTKMYLIATQKAMVALARDGTPVLASEAVLGNSVPDETGQVKAAVAKAMADQTGAR